MAHTDDQTGITKACARAAVRIFIPLVRMLLRHGIPYKTVADWLRWCYAHVAYDEYALPNRKQSKSRVAVISGLTRVDVDRLLNRPSPAEAEGYQQYQRAAMVLAGWAAESEQKRNGIGDVVAYEGGSNDFSTLVERHSRGTTPRSVRDELLRAGCIEDLEGGMIKLIKREYVAHSGADVESEFDILGHAAGSLIQTIAHNTEATTNDETLLQGLAFSAIPADKIDLVAAHIKTRARELLYEIDDFLTDQANTDAGNKPQLEAGLGVHFFVNELPDSNGHEEV